jgi:hypothetical protein
MEQESAYCMQIGSDERARVYDIVIEDLEEIMG